MTSLPSHGTDEHKTAIRKGYRILACIVMTSIAGAIFIKLKDGELSNSILFAILCGFVAGLLGLLVISRVKKQQRSEKKHNTGNEA